MRRAFLVLYSLIVLAVISVGWGLDKLWQHHNPVDDNTQAQHSLQLASHFMAATEPEQRQAQLQQLHRATGLQFQLHPLDDFAHSLLLTRIANGDPVMVHRDGMRVHYQRLSDEPWVLSWQQPQPHGTSLLLYDLLLLAFYLVLALVVWLWAWPLSRDLNKLQQQTRYLGLEPVPPHLAIGPSSAVHGLASAFNAMAQRVKDLLASHKEMTYAVSHELRTPLARMKFGLEMAQNMEAPPGIRKQLAGLREDVTEMDTLVNQLFDYAGFEQSDRPLNWQAGDMAALVEQLIARVQNDQNPKHDLQFERINTLPSGLPQATVLCEWYLMERALINLLHNAQRYAARRVRIRLSADSQGYCVQVDDDGPGIAEEDRERVFQSFVRLTNHTNSQVRGLGLGLAMVARILRWHGGQARADTSPEGGARLELRWPRPH